MEELEELEKTNHSYYAHFSLVESKDGTFFLNNNDIYISRDIRTGAGWEKYFDFVLQDIFRTGDVVLDIGANNGVHTVRFSKLAQQVYAFEPCRFLYNQLNHNLILNRCTNVVTYRCGIGKEKSIFKLPTFTNDFLGYHNWGAIHLNSENKGDQVPVYSLDSFQFEKVDIIKVDIEGMEIDFILGCLQTLKKFSPTLLMEINLKNLESVRKLLSDDLGYTIKRIRYYCPEDGMIWFSPNYLCFQESKNFSFHLSDYTYTLPDCEK
jgi:FkbM family methyltransferase